MSIEGLERLEAWKRSKDFAISIYKDVLWLLPPEEKWGLNQQIRRAAQSVPANIAEGYGRFHYKENRQFQYFARGSLHEAHHWLRRARVRKLMTEQRSKEFLDRLADLAPQLNAYIRTLDRRSRKENSQQPAVHAQGQGPGPT